MKKTSDDLVIDEESAKVLLDKTTSFLKKNRMVLAVSLIIAIIIVSGTITITALQKSRDEKSSFLLSEIMDLIKNDSNSGSSLKAIEEKIKQNKAINDLYKPQVTANNFNNGGQNTGSTN